MATRRQPKPFTIDGANLKEIERDIERGLALAAPKITYEVAVKTLALINASGRVPVDTGALKASTVIRKDKFDKDGSGHIAGWVGIPYAAKRYYGVGTKKRVYRTTKKGRNLERKQYATGSTPFWDRPITNNSKKILRLYYDAARKALK